MSKKNKKSKDVIPGISIKPILIIVIFLVIFLTIYIIYRTSISNEQLLSISLISLFAGLLFESFRISDNWKTTTWIFLGSYIASLLSFLPGKREHDYNFESHIEMWPYMFIIFYTIMFGVIYKDKVTSKLTEGITLLLSISFLYWIIDFGLMNFDNRLLFMGVAIGFVFSIFSIINALTYIQLSRTNRLILSIWSTVVMFAFAIDNIFRVFSIQNIEGSEYLLNEISIGTQYFLVGISSIYIMQDFMLLADFLPSKNGNYRNELIEIKKDHIDRYSDTQVNIKHSIFCIIFVGTTYYLNYKYQVLPRHTIIWLMILTFPFILKLLTLIEGEKKTSKNGFELNHNLHKTFSNFNPIENQISEPIEMFLKKENKSKVSKKNK